MDGMINKRKYTDYIKSVFIKYSAIIIISVFCLYIVSLFVVYHLVVVDKNYQANAEFNSILVDNFKAYEDSLDKLASSNPIKKALSNEKDISNANELLYDFRNSREFKGNFALIDMEGGIITTNLYKDNAESLHSVMLKQSLEKMKRGQSVHQRLDFNMFQNGQQSRYYFASPVMDNQNVKGYLFYFLEEFKGDALSLSDFTIVSDTYNNVIYTSDDSLITSVGKNELSTKENKKIVDIDGVSYFLTHEKLMNEQFNTYNLTSIRIFEQMVLYGILSFLGITLFMALLIYWISPKIMNESVQSFQKLLQYISHPESNTKEQSFEEFQLVEKEFTKKIQEIKKLNRINHEMTEIKRKMELKQLEAQFNPHFTFNVLEMLRYEIYFDQKNADRIILSFANLMRYSTYYGETTIALGTDLEYVEDYLKLQKMRFNKRLNYDINIKDSLKDAKIPKLIIQPLIENSIKHNIECTKHLQINISICQVGKELWLSVRDDGKGIKNEVLNELLKMLESEEPPDNYYGLYHCQRTIQLLFGREYGLTVTSLEKEGTNVTIRIPFDLNSSATP